MTIKEKKLFLKLTKNHTRQEKQKLLNNIELALSGNDQNTIDNISKYDLSIIIKILEKRLEELETDLNLYQEIYNKIYT